MPIGAAAVLRRGGTFAQHSLEVDAGYARSCPVAAQRALQRADDAIRKQQHDEQGDRAIGKQAIAREIGKQRVRYQIEDGGADRPVRSGVPDPPTMTEKKKKIERSTRNA